MENSKKFDMSFLHKDNDSTPLKKRGKLHKYKISDGCFDFLEESSHSTASIYKERYCHWQTDNNYSFLFYW